MSTDSVRARDGRTASAAAEAGRVPGRKEHEYAELEYGRS